jgi:hypothetical protein
LIDGFEWRILSPADRGIAARCLITMEATAQEKFDRVAKALLDAPIAGVLTVLRRDGTVLPIVTWFGREDSHVTANAGQSTVWLKVLRRDPRVSLAVIDPENMYRYLRIVGEVVSVEEDVNYAHIDALTKLYDGVEHYTATKASEYTRYKIVVDPKQVWSSEDGATFAYDGRSRAARS